MYYEKNRQALSIIPFHKPILAKLDTVEPTNDVELLQTEAGDYTLLYKGVLLHSMAGAEAEARALADQYVRVERKIQHALIGIGLGYVLQAIFEKEEHGKIWVYEPDLPLLRFILENVDLTDYFKSERVILITTSKEMRVTISDYYAYGDTVDVIYSDGYAQLMGDELTRVVKEELMGPINIKRRGLTTIFSYQKEWNRYFCQNMRYFSTIDPFTKLEDQFKDKPAFVVSAGPSLEKAIEDIKALQDKAVIISVGTALRALIHAGITPDFACFMDYGGLSKQLAGIEDKVADVNFILSPFVEPICYQVKTKNRFQVYLSNYADYCNWIEKQIGVLRPHMNSGGTVSILAFRSAFAMGCKPIILLGQDLAISGTQLYAGGIGGKIDQNGHLIIEESEQVLEKRLELMEVKGQNGNMVKSPPDYVQYIDDFQQAIRQIRQDDPDYVAYNASVGGAWLEGYEHKSLAELRQVLQFSTFDKTIPEKSETGENYTDEQKRQHCIQSLEILISVVKDCLKLSKEAREYLVFLKQGIPIVNGKDYERRYLTVYKQFLARIYSHPVLNHFLQRENWLLHRNGNMESNIHEDIIANFAAEDQFHESAQQTLEYTLPAMEESLAELKKMAPLAQGVT